MLEAIMIRHRNVSAERIGLQYEAEFLHFHGPDHS
jgi:hypothetical protein